MNHPLLVFVGIFAALVFSWGGLIFGGYHQLGRQAATPEVGSSRLYPLPPAGRATQGLEVYRATGCVQCHSQQVQPGGMESDQKRGWGKRRSVARDYLYGATFQIGHARLGPDLANVGSRAPAQFASAWTSAIPDLQTNNLPTPEERLLAAQQHSEARREEVREWHLLHLYNPQITSPGSMMPASKHLFIKRRIGHGASLGSLRLTGKFAVEPGFEVVPTEEALALVDYLLGLQERPYLFEAPNPVRPLLKKESPTEAAPEATNAPAAQVPQP